MSQRTSNFTKRTRFEILRRDHHACRYCGAKAPDVTLQVDHIVPVALGGTNDPDNGITSCVDCNQGKASVPADAALVEEARNADKAFRDALRSNLEQQTEEALLKRTKDNHWLNHIIDHWCKKVSLEDTYPVSMEATLLRWKEMGCPDSLIIYSMDITASRVDLIGNSWRQWKYTCGVMWKRIEMASKEASSV